MAAETVKFYVVNQTAVPVLGVLVRVFDATGATFITQDTTVDVGGNAVAEVTLDGNSPANAYTIRMSKAGVAFDGGLGDQSKSPQLIEVYSPPTAAPNAKNEFDITCETFDRPVATDPRLCRASGFFKDGAGRPLANLDIKLINQFKPALVDGNAVLGERLDIRTDDDGYCQVDLYRYGEYRAWIQSIQTAEADPTGAITFSRMVEVPDQSSINLVDLLFPIVGSVAFTPDPVSVAVDAIVNVSVVALATDQRVLCGTGSADINYSIEDISVATLTVLADELIIRGEALGTTQLVATRQDQSIVSIPSAAITGSPLSITVV